MVLIAGALPLAWLLSVTLTAGIQKIAHPAPRIGFLAQANDLAARLASGAIPAAEAAKTQVLIFNARLDAAVTALFMVLVVGFSRVFFGLKGWEFYIYNWAFWVKIGAFVAVGLLSIVPTARIVRWHQAARTDPAYEVPAAEVAHARRFVRAQGMVFVLIPIFAAVMARGIGL